MCSRRGFTATLKDQKIKTGNLRIDVLSIRFFFALIRLCPQLISSLKTLCRNVQLLLMDEIKKRYVTAVSFGIYILFTAVRALASSSNVPVTIGTIVVTANATAPDFQTGDVDTELTPAFYSVIKRKRFEGKIEDLSQVIKEEPSIQVRQSGGMGSFSSISIRGSSSDQVNIFLDGILLNDASGGGVDLSNISLSDVGAIEIYRGITPVNFGQASIGGVVNIRTRRTKKGLKSSITTGYGSFHTRKLGAFINCKPGRWDYLISGDYLASDNDFRFLNDKGTVFNKADDRIERRHNAQFDQQNLLTKFGLDITDDIRIDLLNQCFLKDQNLPDWKNNKTTRTSFDTKRDITTFKLTANNIGPIHLNTSTQVYYGWKNEDYDDRLGQIGLGRQHTISNTRRCGTNIFLEWLNNWNTVGLMLHFQHEKYDSKDHLNRSNPTESGRNLFSLALQDSIAFFQDSLIITPALRLTRLRDRLMGTTSIFSGVQMPGNSRRDSHFSPQIGLKYRPLSWLTLKTNLGRYVREPSFFELFGDRGFFLGNENLRAEKGVNFDLGLEINLFPEGPWLRHVSISCAYFHSNVNDLITRSFDARGVGKSVNISKTEIHGIETGFKMNFLKIFRFIANATWQDTENQSDIKAFNGNYLPGRYRRSYLERIEAMYDGLKVWSEIIEEKGVYYDTANLLRAKDKKEINAGISWRFRSALLTFEARNLEDEQHEDFNGFPMPGRSYYFTLKYSF